VLLLHNSPYSSLVVFFNSSSLGTQKEAKERGINTTTKQRQKKDKRKEYNKSKRH